MTTRVRNTVLAGVMGALLVSSSARADNIFGEFKRLPDQIQKGFSVGFDIGLLWILSQKFTSATNPGFNLTFTTGYDLFEYLAVEGVYQLGINQASPDDPQLQGGINTFLFNFAAKGQYPLGRFYPFLEVGPGFAYSKPSWKGNENYKMALLVAAGCEYYTYLRHFSLYMRGSYDYIFSLPPKTFVLGAGLKYTF